jgi:hypothetical protein
LAYDALKDTDEDSGNPYSGTLTSFGGGQGFIQGQAKSHAPQQTAPQDNSWGGVGGPSATGYVNFDRLYNANADVAHREAGKRTDAAEKAAQGAQAARTGAQQSFSDAVRTGTLATPEQQHYAWRDHGATGVQHGKQVTGAYSHAPGMEQPTPGGPGLQGKYNKDEHRTSEVINSDYGSDEADRRAVARGRPDKNGKVWKSLEEYDAAHRAPSSEPTNPNQSYVTEQGEGLTSNVTRTSGAPADGPVSPLAPKTAPTGQPQSSFYDTSNDAAIEAQVRERAKAEYTGPDSLSGMDGYEKLLQETVAAQDLANNPLTGLGDTDRALLGAAGRPRMAELQQKYGGLTKELDAANVASRAEADAARKATDETADVYEELLALYEGRKAGEQAGEDRETQRSDDILSGAEKRKQDQLAYNEAMRQSRSGINAFRNTMHDVASVTSPSHLLFSALGEKTPLEAGTNWFGQNVLGDEAGKFNAGNASDAWGEDDADVFASMTEADWTEFNAMGLADQKAWIAERKKKLRGGS